jgi:hypothetical protein
MKPDLSKEPNRLLDPYWRKARIAARQLLKREAGQPWSSRDQRLAAQTRARTTTRPTGCWIRRSHRIGQSAKMAIQSRAGSLDIPITKLNQLDEKDLNAFCAAVAGTGHPIESALIAELQFAVDFCRPSFEATLLLASCLLRFPRKPRVSPRRRQRFSECPPATTLRLARSSSTRCSSREEIPHLIASHRTSTGSSTSAGIGQGWASLQAKPSVLRRTWARDRPRVCPAFRISIVSPFSSHLERRAKSLRRSRTVVIFKAIRLCHKKALPILISPHSPL